MKKRNFIQTIKVGIFSLVGILIITALIFYIGSRQQAFGSKKEITATFRNVGGLKTGNTVRYAGVTIGSVEEIRITSDSSVSVTLLIDSHDSRFIKNDSRVSISTEGLLGSKYVKILPGSAGAASIRNGDHLPSIEPVDFDEILTVLNDSGNNFRSITGNVDEIVSKINQGEGMLGAIISDTLMDEKVGTIVESFNTTGIHAARLSAKMIEAVDTLKSVGGNTVEISEELKIFAKKLNNDSSTLGRIISDTVMANSINTTMDELKTTAEEVKETSARVKDSWIVKLFGKKNKKNQ